MRTHRRDGETGLALVLALLFIVLLSVLVVNFSYDGQIEASFAENRGNGFEAHLAARSGVARGLGLLAEDLLPENTDGDLDLAYLDTTLDPWYYGNAFDALNDYSYMRTSVSDEYGKINLNALLDNTQDPPVEREPLVTALREFFLERDPEADADMLVDSILDWIDSGDDDEERPAGAETDFYEAAEIPYPCKNGPMDSIEELLLIQGMTEKLYWGDPEVEEQMPLPEYLTVHGDWNGRINVNTASLEVLAALIGAARNEPFDYTAGEEIWLQTHEEELPYRQPAELNSYFPAADAGAEEDGQDEAEPGNDEERPPGLAEQLLRVNSNVFRIRGDGRAGDDLVRIEAYVWRTPLDETSDINYPADYTPPAEPYRILDWRVIR